MQGKARWLLDRMRLKIIQINDLQESTIHNQGAIENNLNEFRTIESGQYSITLLENEMKFLIVDDEKTIETLFTPHKITQMLIKTEYGETKLDVKTTFYGKSESEIELKYHLLSQSQIIDSFHFKFLLK